MEKREQIFYREEWKSVLCVCLFLSTILLVLSGVSSCSLEDRHKILTFFFEGVPQLGGDKVFLTVTGSTNSDRNFLEDKYSGSNVKNVLGQRGPSRHKPSKECGDCHVGGIRQRQQRLTRPIPDLCYKCHLNYEELGVNLHGPIGVGECLFCHRPHQSPYVKLQQAPQPDLCYRCHAREGMHMIIGHEDKIESKCTDCHDPHSSIRKKLLKPIDEMPKDPNSI